VVKEGQKLKMQAFVSEYAPREFGSVRDKKKFLAWELDDITYDWG